MKRPKELGRRWNLRQIAKRLQRLSGQRVPQMSAEERLSQRVKQHVEREGGIDEAGVRDLEQVIDSHVVEMKAEIFRHHKAEDMELGKLEARLDGLTAQYQDDERRLLERIAMVGYQRRGAMRAVEDRDTSMPAGPDGIEEEGYQHGNVGDLVGRNLRSRIVLYIVLALAMIADLITFRQVVERVVNDSAVFPLVLALTATTTYVAHRSGEFFKAAKETYRNFRRNIGGWALGGTWLAMGIGAFVFRLLAPPPVSNAVQDFVSGGTASTSSATGSAVLSAVLMALLYSLTGAIALAAGYQRPRPEVDQFRRADRAIRRAGPRLAALRRDVVEAEALHKQLTDLRADRVAHFTVEVGRCQAAAQRVKAEAAMLIRRLRSGDRRLGRRASGGRFSFRRPDEPNPDGFRDVPDDVFGRKPANADSPTVEIPSSAFRAGEPVYESKSGRAAVPDPRGGDDRFSGGAAASWSTPPSNPGP